MAEFSRSVFVFSRALIDSLSRIGSYRRVGLLLVALSALVFALFLRVTLYGRVAPMAVGPKGLFLPAVVLLAILAWHFAVASAVRRERADLGVYRDLMVAAGFLPMLATLPIIVGVLGSDAYAREYWIDRSLKVQLLLGLPAIALCWHAGIWAWARRGWTWRRVGPVLLVLSVAFALRFAGMGWGLPFAFQPEEASIYVRWAIEAALNGQWDPHYFQNPSLLIHLLGVEFLGLFGVSRILQFGQDPGDLYMVFRGEQDLFYTVARLNSVVLGVATVLLVYLIGRRLWSERAGLVASSILAVSFLHVRNSQYAVNDVPSTFFLVACLYFSLLISEKGRWRDYLLAGLLAGLAASTKYNAGLIVVAIVVAHWANSRSLSAALMRGPLARLQLAEVAAIVGFLMGTPYALLNFPLFQDGFLEQLAMGGAAWSGQSLSPTFWQFLTGLVQGAGLAVAVFALAGIYFVIVRDRWRGAVLVSFPLSYLAFMSAMNLFFVRWVVPAMPFVALLAAAGLEAVLVRVQRPAAPRDRSAPWSRLLMSKGVTVVVVVVLLMQPALFSLRLDWLARQTDTREEANGWAERNLTPGSKVAMEAYSLLDQESLAFRATLQQLDVDLVWRATMHDLTYYRIRGYDYLAVSSFNYDRAFSQPDRYADRVEFYQQLDRELPLLAVFSPRSDGTATPFDLDDTDTPFWHLFSYDRPGPTVKVYRVGG